MLELSNLCHCVQHPWKLTSRDFWSSRNTRKPLSKQKCVLRKCSAVSQKWWMLDLSNLCHCVQHPWKLTSRDFWSSRNDGKPLSKQKCVLTKCCGVSQKWWTARAFKPLPLCSAKVGSSATFCVLVCKSSLLWYWGVIGQRRFICHVWCSSIQGIYSWFPRGSIGQSRFICHVLCSGMQVISALVLGGSLAKEGSSAKFGVAVFKASLLW